MDAATILRGPPESRVQAPRIDLRKKRYKRYGITVEEYLARKRYEAELNQKPFREPARSYLQIAHDAQRRPGADYGGCW